MTLRAAHRGYQYQDLLAAARLVDVLLGSIIEAHVDEKLVPDDRFDDLTTVDESGYRERTQFKHTDNADRPLTLATFTSDARSLRMDRIISSALADRNGPGSDAREFSYRIVLRDAPPTDDRLLSFIRPASPDPGPFLPEMTSMRMRFDADALWQETVVLTASKSEEANPFAFIRKGGPTVEQSDLDWVCEHLVVELAAPIASLDLTTPGAVEHLLLERVRNEVGAGMYPNKDRSSVDVAEALISAARAARQGALNVTASELLRRARLRNDFGAVARSNPVDKAIEINRLTTVADLVKQATIAADTGKALLVVGPPGHGKSWICQQMIDVLADTEWLVAEHYCYLGDADGERLPRVLAETVFGSLLGRIADHDPRLVSKQRPRLAANEQALTDAVVASVREKPDRRLALVVDGIDHVTRVRTGGPAFDPSFTLAEALASLGLPRGSVLIVLSQPGRHLEPIEAAGAISVQIPNLMDGELRQLASRLGIVSSNASDTTRISEQSPLLSDEEASEEFVATLSERSRGNALYAMYLCRETLRNPTTVADPSATVRGLPQFDGSLLSYYQHIHASLGDQGAWVADVIALLDFPVSRTELKELRPDMAHRVDQALSQLRPVLVERATQGGVRIYHESFARFLRQPFKNDTSAKIALLDRIIEWLERRGMFKDSRAYRYLLPTLSEANYDQRVVDAVDRDFVVRSIASGFPASAIVGNLATAVGSAARIGNWPAVVRYVEMSRSAETYQEERFESEIVSFVDVVGSLLGAETLAERLLHDGRPIMAARAGLQMCAAVDTLGAVAPWREYMLAFLRESQDDNTMYGEASDRAVNLAWLRGRLRLASMRHGVSTDPDQTFALSTGRRDSEGEHSGNREERLLYAPVKWKRLAARLDRDVLPATGVVEAILDTFGKKAVVELIGILAQPGSCCLALAEKLAAGKVPESPDDALNWALRAAGSGLPPGNVFRLFAIGVNVRDLDVPPIGNARDRLLALTREVQDDSIRFETAQLGEWIDACTIAARRDPLGLGTVEALLEGPGWYTCWLRFTIALVIAEAASEDEQSHFGLAAIRILNEVQDPFLGKPRACDLYPIHNLIDETIRRAVSLLDEQAWEKALEILDRVSTAVSTTMFGEQGGPLPRDSLLHLAVETATTTRMAVAQNLVNGEIENGGADRYYADLAEYRLIAARLALKAGDPIDAQRHWTDACRLLTAYGWHKDVTIYELLDPLSALIACNPARGRESVAKLQPLCERVPFHTDKKETRGAWSRWWQLLAEADPCALSKLVLPSLLSSCNDPNWLLHGARSDLWRAWHHRADPMVAGVLRLTLEEALDRNDPTALGRLADITDGSGSDEPSRLMVALLARIDERPLKYSVSDSSELLDRDRERVDALNAIAERTNVSQVFSSITPPDETDDPGVPHNRRREVTGIRNLPEIVIMTFPPGAVGIAQAIRAWQSRQYDETRPAWSVERFANVLGYRMIELVEERREEDAAASLRLIADAGRFNDGSKLLNALARGFERQGRGSLAAVAYTLAWTRARGRGGWMRFGGETEIESLQRGTRLDKSLVHQTIAGEIEQILSRGGGTNGITQALMYGFAKGGLGTSRSVAFDIWDEAFAVIAGRAPRVALADDPDDVYEAPESDSGTDVLGDIDAAFASAAVAGLASAAREEKRRSLMAAQMLIEERPAAIAGAVQTAIASLSDPATLTWLLRIIELAGEQATPVVSKCRNALVELAGRHHLVVRSIALRLLSGSEVPLAPSADPDPELLERRFAGLVLPAGVDGGRENTEILNGMIQEAAGIRLSHAERVLPHLKEAVYSRVEVALNSDVYRHRLKKQLDAYADRLRKRWPDAYLAPYEAIEDAIQRAAAGGRAARLINGEAIPDPAAFEQDLSRALLDDTELPVAIESTRQPRPNIPLPPPRGDPLWSALCGRADGGSIDETGIETAIQENGTVLGTISTLDAEAVPILKGGCYDGWRLVATVERRIIPSPDWRSKEDDIAERYRVIELRLSGDRQAFTLPPISNGDIRAWGTSFQQGVTLNEKTQSQPVIGVDYSVPSAVDGHHGLGIQTPLLTPTRWLFTTLMLQPKTHFALDDDDGPALALITWRTEYETSDYHLPWPRLVGAGLVVRSDVFDRLVYAAQEKLIFRDFLEGPASLNS